MSSLDEHHTHAWAVRSVTRVSAAAGFTGEKTTAQSFSNRNRVRRHEGSQVDQASGPGTMPDAAGPFPFYW